MTRTRSSRCTISCAVVLLAELAVLISSSEAAYSLPSSFKRCALDDVKLNDCLENALPTALYVMKDGLPSLGVLPIDPLLVEQININGGGSGSVKLDMNIKNLTLFGMSEVTVLDHSASLDNYTMRFRLLIPELRTDFMHELDGKVLMFPIRGSGPGSCVMKELQTNHTIKFSPVKKRDGKTYWHIDEYSFQAKPKDAQIDFIGLFPENKKLGEEMRKYLRQNSFLLFEELGVYFEEAFGVVFKEVGNLVFDKIPIDQIFMT